MALVAATVGSVYTRVSRAWAALGYVVRTSATSVVTADPTISSGSGAPSAAEPTGSIYLRTGQAATSSLYVRDTGGGGQWTALTNAAGVGDDTTFAFGAGADATIEYDENGTDQIRVVGPTAGWVWTAGTQDWTATVTGADELHNVDLSVNHATAQGVGVDASAIQLTTPRTSGIMAALAGATTSLVGDAGGTYADFYAKAPTDGGGSATHVALLVGAGHDRLIDASAALTAQNLVVLPGNVADALTFGDGTLVWTRYTSTTATPGLAHTFARTGAGAAVAATNALNHATNTGQALSAALVQTTTARSSGTVGAVAGATTSLAGDLGGTYADFLALAPTDGGGTCTHVALHVAAGHDVLIDASSAATGESDIVIGDNLASALEIREAANTYLRVVTTNDLERVEAKKIFAFPEVTVVDMADAAHALVLGTAGAGQTKLIGNVVLCDANSSGTEALTLPTAASCDGLCLIIVNTGGEDITMADVLTGLTLSTTEVAWVVCNGTAWYGGVMKLT